jgi:hypothetical protein
VLREDEHRDRRVAAADLGRRDQAVVGVPRRHPDVDDRDVGLVGTHLQHEVVGVHRPPHDLVAGVGQKRGDPFAEQRVVVRDDDSERPNGFFPCAFDRCSVSGAHDCDR